MKRSLLILAALLGLSAPALAQTRPLPQGEIRANGDITFGNALKLGKREGNKTVITPDTLQILGSGSTGDASMLSVTPSTSAPAGTLARQILNALPSGRRAVEQGQADDLSVTAAGGNTARRQADRAADIYRARDFGAICDGVSHPLSSRYGSLAAAQAVYPAATALSDEIDWAAAQLAIDQRAATGGGRVEIGSGTCLWNRTLTGPGGGVGYAALQIAGQGVATTIRPTASMASLITLPSGHIDISSLSLVNVNSFASAGVLITKPNNNLPVRVRDNRIIGFTSGISLTGDNIDIDSNFFLNNTTAILATACLNNRIRSNYVLGGNGFDFTTGSQQCEGVSGVQNIVLPGLANRFALRITAGLQLDFTDNIFDQIISGPGVVIDASSAAVNAVTIKGGYIGAQGNATATTDGVQVKGGAQNVTLSGVTFIGWYGYDINASTTSHLALTDIRALSTTGIGNVLLANAPATSLRGGFYAHTSSTITESGSTVTMASGAHFTATPSRVTASQYLNNYGDGKRELSVSGGGGTDRLNVVGGNGAVTVAPTGTSSDIFFTFQSKGVAPIIFAPNGQTRAFLNTTAFVRQVPEREGAKVTVVATGATLGVAASTSLYSMLQTGTLASQTLNLPIATGDGHLLRISTSGAITSLTLAPQPGDTVQWTGGSSLAANSGLLFCYDSTSKIWLRLQ